MLRTIRLTILFGRIYCSVICPLGVFQDAISWVSGKRKKNRFRYSPAMKWIRYGVLAVFIIAMIVGLNALAILIAPYSAYGLCFVRSGLAVGKQPSGILCRTGRQLCFL